VGTGPAPGRRHLSAAARSHARRGGDCITGARSARAARAVLSALASARAARPPCLAASSLGTATDYVGAAPQSRRRPAASRRWLRVLRPVRDLDWRVLSWPPFPVKITHVAEGGATARARARDGATGLCGAIPRRRRCGPPPTRAPPPAGGP
jgi:hypothetical protein